MQHGAWTLRVQQPDSDNLPASGNISSIMLGNDPSIMDGKPLFANTD